MGLYLAAVSVCILGIAVLFAHVDKMLLPSQMTEHHCDVGFPLVANGSLWANLVLMSGVLCIVGEYRNQWSDKEMLVAGIIGAAVSYALFHFVYARGKFPDALAGGGRPISSAGKVMMAYTAMVIAVLLLFYTCTNVLWADVSLIGLLLSFYIPIANHVVLEFLRYQYDFSWCPPLFNNEIAPIFLFALEKRW